MKIHITLVFFCLHAVDVALSGFRWHEKSGACRLPGTFFTMIFLHFEFVSKHVRSGLLKI